MPTSGDRDATDLTAPAAVSHDFTPGQWVDGLRCDGYDGCGSTKIRYVGPDDELPGVGEFRCASPRHHSAGTFCARLADVRPADVVVVASVTTEASR